MRHFLNGRFENSVFCLLSPDGRDWLTRSGRGPEMVFGPQTAAAELKRIARRYPLRVHSTDAVVQDFHSFRQALNVASADQRVLVLASGPEADLERLRTSLRPVASDKQVLGRFHFDFDESEDWTKVIDGEQSGRGIVMIHPGEFGLKGTVIRQLPLAAENAEIVQALADANAKFASTTEKKVYRDHVKKGNRLGIYFEGAVPYGEDRDGDGKIDHRGGRDGRGSPRRP